MTHPVKICTGSFSVAKESVRENGWDYSKKAKFSTENEYRLVFMGLYYTHKSIFV